MGRLDQTDLEHTMPGQPKILVVDDTAESLKLLTDILREEGYEVRSSISGEFALLALQSFQPDLALLDIRMPGMDGYEVCRRMKANTATGRVPVIFVSANTDTGEKVEGFRVGAVDYVTKPYQRDELMARVRTHLELHALRSGLESMVKQRTAEVQDRESSLRNALLDSVTTLASVVELRDPYTAGHQRRVATLAHRISQQLKFSREQIEGVHLAGAVLDIGKMQIPAEILSKPARLSDLEFRMVKEHATNGYEILKQIRFPWPIAEIVLQHHERMDGSGYPRGLSGEQILPEARVIGLSDVVSAMVSHRPYRPARTMDETLEEITRGRGIRYDPAVVDACSRILMAEGIPTPDT